MQALAQLNIAHLADTLFHALSGGQQQLVMIARALVSASQNILLDEPCSALDLANQQTVLQLISNLAHGQSRTVVFTTHDPTHALQIASHTLLLLPNGEWLAGQRRRSFRKQTCNARMACRCVRSSLRITRARCWHRCFQFTAKKPASRRQRCPTSIRMKAYSFCAFSLSASRATW